MSVSGSEPDFTRAVMGRLGYMRVDARVARRRVWRRRLVRSGAALGLIAVVGLGVHLQQRGRAAQHAEVMTIPTAIQHDVTQTEERVRGVFNRLRTILPATPVEEAYPDALPATVERSGMGPIDNPEWWAEVGGEPVT